MDSHFKIDLKNKTPSNNHIEFLHAELPSSGSPFIRIYYSEQGHEQRYALRFDIDKGVFLDRLENPVDDQFVRDSARAIAHVVSENFYTAVG
jgi:hypothetical protein